MAAGNSENDPIPPDQLARLLELELQQKRAAWQHDKQRLGVLRVASFLFLFLVIIGALAAWWLLAPNQLRDERHGSPAATATPLPGATPH